jgi:hypothetical protein
MLLPDPDLEERNDRQQAPVVVVSAIKRGCRSLHTRLSGTLNMSEHNEGKKSRQGNWEQTSVSRWKDRSGYTPRHGCSSIPGQNRQI